MVSWGRDDGGEGEGKIRRREEGYLSDFGPAVVEGVVA